MLPSLSLPGARLNDGILARLNLPHGQTTAAEGHSKDETMIMLNTMSGMRRKPVQAKITTTVQLVVGGTDDEDRKDSVQELFDDHKEEIMASLSGFFKEGLVSATIGDIEMLETKNEGDGDGE